MEETNRDDEMIVGMKKSEILDQARTEHEMSLQYVRAKRVDFRDRLRLYNNQRKQRDKIGILTLYTTMNTLLAVYYSDEMAVEFAGRERGDQLLADAINRTAKFDHDEMGMDAIDYFVQWDRLFYGVGLRDISCYDVNTNTPVARSMNPLCWLPDPRGTVEANGGTGGFRFYGFEVDRSKADMEGKNFFNLQNLAIRGDDEKRQDMSATDEAYGLDSQLRDEKNYRSGDYTQVDWYTQLTNERGETSKYLITCDTEFRELFRIEKLKAVTDEEKKDESLVPWPLVTNYYSPQRDNPFGTSVADLVEDKQRAKSILANLRIAKEKAAVYPMYLYNTQKIRNRRDLDFGFNKAIPVNADPNEPLSNALMPIQHDKNDSGTFAQEQSLDAEAQIATGADQMQSGVMSSQNRTLGEVQQVTANAQTRYMLGSRVNAWGEKKFWALWYRLYRQYFTEGQKKVIRLQGGQATRFATITRKDFVTKEDPDIRIASQFQLRSEKEKKRLAFTQIAPLLLSDPTRPKASRTWIEREILRLNDVDDDLMSIISPYAPDESKALSENELLGRNRLAKIAIGEDHMSHLVIHGFAEDSAAKFAHMQAHRQAYVLSGQQANDKMLKEAQGQTANNSNMANTAQGQIGSQLMAGRNVATPAGA